MFLSHFWAILAPFWGHFCPFWGSFLGHFGVILGGKNGLFCAHQGGTLGCDKICAGFSEENPLRQAEKLPKTDDFWCFWVDFDQNRGFTPLLLKNGRFWTISGRFQVKKRFKWVLRPYRIGSGQIFLACDKAFKHNSTRNCAPTELEKQFGRPPIDCRTKGSPPL